MELIEDVGLNEGEEVPAGEGTVGLTEGVWKMTG